MYFLERPAALCIIECIYSSVVLYAVVVVDGNDDYAGEEEEEEVKGNGRRNTC